MKRRDFLLMLASLSLSGCNMKPNSLNKVISFMSNTEKMPVLFLGHGSPMNAIEDNEFVREFQKLAKEIKKPQAILCISAHWETNGTYVTAMERPRTIHDFGGFPKSLYDVQYPASGSPILAKKVKKIITKTNVDLDNKWGLDHGAWSVIKHLYPKADIPVIQMSIDKNKSPQYHYDLAKQLSELRRKGVLIVGSGNMVHNLRLMAWSKLNKGTYAFDWALEASEKMKSFILKGDHKSLINFRSQGKPFDLAIPTPEHFLPLIYSLALKEKNEKVSIFNDKPIAGSLTMTSIKIDS